MPDANRRLRGYAHVTAEAQIDLVEAGPRQVGGIRDRRVGALTLQAR
jgi:hypothetical protein